MKKSILALAIALSTPSAFADISGTSDNGTVITAYSETITIVSPKAVQFYVTSQKEGSNNRSTVKIIYNCVEHMSYYDYMPPDSVGRYVYDGACREAYGKAAAKIYKPKPKPLTDNEKAQMFLQQLGKEASM